MTSPELHPERRARFGDVVVALGLATPEQVDRAVALQRALRKKKIGELLVERGALTAEELRRRLAARKTSSRPIGEYLVQSGCVSESQLRAALEYQDELRKKRVGEILVDQAVLGEKEVARVLAEMSRG